MALLRDAGNGPVRTRKAMDGFRSKVVMDLNSLQRQLGDAQRDFYALYRAFGTLRDSPNRDILLALIGKVCAVLFAWAMV